MDNRRRVDLRRLPVRQQYAIAAAVIAAVIIAAWVVGRDRPVAPWVTGYLVPGLTVGYIVLLIIALVTRVRRRARQRKDR